MKHLPKMEAKSTTLNSSFWNVFNKCICGSIHFREHQWHHHGYYSFFLFHSRVAEAAPHKAIVLPAVGNDVGIKLREQDQSWKDFLSGVNHIPR